jgi:hypothetical protein
MSPHSLQPLVVAKTAPHSGHGEHSFFSRFSSRLIMLAIVALMGCSLCDAQTWYPVVPAAQQSLSTTVVMPTGAQYRFYTPNCLKTGVAAVQTGVAGTAPISDYDDGQNGRPPDPCIGTAKELDVLETSAVQNVVVNGKTVTVPALPPPAVTVVSTTTVTCTLTTVIQKMSDGTYNVTVSSSAPCPAPVVK